MNKRLSGGPRKLVLCIEKGEIYQSLTEAGEILGIKRQNIGQVCRGVQQKTHGLTFRYATDNDLATYPLITKLKKDCEAAAASLPTDDNVEE